jgi:hypothetical protein
MLSNPVRATVDSAARSYKNQLSLTTVFSGKTALQLFFNDKSRVSSADDYLMIVRPYYLEIFPGTSYSETGMFETRSFGLGAEKITYISFGGSPWKKAEHAYPVSGRIKFVEDATKFRVTGIIDYYVDGSKGYTRCVPGAGHSFFSFTNITNKILPYYTTSIYGWNDSSVSNTICGVDRYNYSHLSLPRGLACDARSSNCPDGFPFPLSRDVYGLFSTMNRAKDQPFNEAAVRNMVLPFVEMTPIN